MTAATAPARPPHSFRASRAGAIPLLGGALIAFYVLFPLDRGFPTVPVFGRPLNSASVATLAVLWILIVQSRGQVLSYLREPYCIVQSAYFGVLVLSSLRLESPLVALHSAAVYYCTFVLNYVIVRHITRQRGTHTLVRIVAVVGSIAAVVGILQGIFEVNLPMYEVWFRDYFVTEAQDYTLVTARVTGTLNNPILYGVALALAFPYVLDLRRVSARTLVVSLLLLAIGLSGSRTPLLMLCVLGLGAIVVNRWRVIWALPPLCLGIMLLVQSFGGWSVVGSDPRVLSLMERLGINEGAAATSAALSITYRQDALTEGIREITSEWGALTWLTGRGQFTSALVSEKVYSGYNTVDNVFFGVLYEQGLVGLTLFMVAFVMFLIQTRRVRKTTLHWYVPIALLAAGVSFNWDAYSTFNILAVGSMAITATLAENSTSRRGGVTTATPRAAGRQQIRTGRSRLRSSESAAPASGPRV